MLFGADTIDVFERIVNMGLYAGINVKCSIIRTRLSIDLAAVCA